MKIKVGDIVLVIPPRGGGSSKFTIRGKVIFHQFLGLSKAAGESYLIALPVGYGQSLCLNHRAYCDLITWLQHDFFWFSESQVLAYCNPRQGLLETEYYF